MAWYDAQVPAWLTPEAQLSRVNENAKMVMAAGRYALDQQSELLKQRADVEKRAGFTELAKVAAEITDQDGWTNPKNEARIWEVGRRYPWLHDTPVFKNTIDQVGKAANSERMRLDAETRRLAAEDRGAYLAAQISQKQQQLDDLNMRHGATLEQNMLIANQKADLARQLAELNTTLEREKISSRERIAQADADVEWAKLDTSIEKARLDDATKRYIADLKTSLVGSTDPVKQREFSVKAQNIMEEARQVGDAGGNRSSYISEKFAELRREMGYPQVNPPKAVPGKPFGPPAPSGITNVPLSVSKWEVEQPKK